ncbi:MAG: CoF synthetase [Deltaproteobacteria bacterium]|nr:MAG: CoF synthetase [Deltaproteobacteria bacterium]
MIDFARRRSAYYRDLYAALPADAADLKALPPVTKEGLMANFDSWTTDAVATRESAEAFVADPSSIGRLFLDRYVAFATSGTTGRPAVFLHDKDALRVYIRLALWRRLPSLIRAGSLRTFLVNRARTATIITTGGHFTSSVIEALFRSRFPGLSGRNRVFSLLDPLPELVRELNDFRPAILGSYPTALAILAEEQEAGRLRIRPALALSGAERLSPPVARRIAAAFRCPVRDTYAASEFPGIAFDCRHGRLHVNSDWVMLEPVDAEYRPVPPGVPSSTTLLTNLANRVQPLLRYDLGDSVTELPSPCPCGSRLPSVRPEGRHDEILFLESPEGSLKPVLPLILATVIEETPGVRSYQMMQAGKRLLRLRVDEAPGHDRRPLCEELLRRLRDYLSTQGLSTVTVELSGERPRRNTAGGKLRQFFVEGGNRPSGS